VFWRWIFYAIWQACLILFIGFYTMGHSQDSNGMYGSLYLNGAFVFFAVVIIVNVKVMTSTYLQSFFTFFFSIGSVLFFLLTFWIIAMIPGDDLQGCFDRIWLFSPFYFGAFFVACAIIFVDIGLYQARVSINKLIRSREKARERKEAQKRKKESQMFYRRRITSLDCKAFPF